MVFRESSIVKRVQIVYIFDVCGSSRGQQLALEEQVREREWKELVVLVKLVHRLACSVESDRFVCASWLVLVKEGFLFLFRSRHRLEDGLENSGRGVTALHDSSRRFQYV